MSLLERLGSSLRAELAADPARRAALEAIVARAREAWPDLPVTEAELAAHILSRAPNLDANTPGADLLLALAAAKGSPIAILAMEQRYFHVVDVCRAAVRSTLSTGEAKQRVRDKLFVGPPPRALSYSGKGSFEGWLRVVVTRVLLDEAEKGQQSETLEESLSSIRVSANPETALLRKTTEKDFRAAFHDAVVTLEVRERALLKYALLDGLTVDDIGAIYDVHRSTAARWVAAAARTLESRLRDVLRTKLGAGDDEVERLVRLVESKVDLSLSRELGG